MKTLIVILGVATALFVLAIILLAVKAFKAAGAAMEEFEKWRG